MAGTVRGFVALDRGDGDAAERDAREVLTAVEPHNPLAPAQVAPRVLLAAARQLAGDPATAIGLLAPIATAGDGCVLLFSKQHALARYASALLADGRCEQALDWAQRACAAPAEDVRSRVVAAEVLAESLAVVGRGEEARIAAQRAVNLAYATEQSSERRGADALNDRLASPRS
jgi:hypothetical protein